jgi:uncharacterized protein
VPGLDALLWLGLAAVGGGLVRGFTGFGTALVYVPVAAKVLGPVEAVVSMLFLDILAAATLTPAALRIANRGEAFRMSLGGVVMLPVGVWLLTIADPAAFRWIVSLLALGLLVLLAGGFRYERKRGPGLVMAAGGLGGFLGGFSGMTGPPVILFYLSGREESAGIRANLIVFFGVYLVAALAVFGVTGLLTAEMAVLGLLLSLPYTVAAWLGAWLFRLRGDALYRRGAYVMVAVAALSGLPVLG